MVDKGLVKRYSAYYQGWCLAFGEHEADYEEGRPVNWLFGEGRIGLILSPELYRQLQHDLLGKHGQTPQLCFSEDSIGSSSKRNPLPRGILLKGVPPLREMLLTAGGLHMYLCSHFVYPQRTRIITFSQSKPTLIMYKEMEPLELIIE